MGRALSICSEVSLFLPKVLETGRNGKRYFRTYICDKAKFKRKEYNFRMSLNTFERIYLEDRSKKFDLDVVTIKNSGFRLFLDDYPEYYGYQGILVRVLHPELEKYDFPIYVVMRHPVLLRLISGIGYMTDGEIHGEFCLDFNNQSGSDWTFCNFILEDSSKSEVDEAKKIGEVISSQRRVNISNWIPGHRYILNPTSTVIYLGTLDSFKYLPVWGNEKNKSLPLLVTEGLYYRDRKIVNDPGGGYVVYMIKDPEDEKRIRDFTLSDFLDQIAIKEVKDIPERYSYYGYYIFRNGKYGWDFGEYSKDNISTRINLRKYIDQSCINAIRVYWKNRNLPTIVDDIENRICPLFISICDRSGIPQDVIDIGKEIYLEEIGSAIKTNNDRARSSYYHYTMIRRDISLKEFKESTNVGKMFYNIGLSWYFFSEEQIDECMKKAIGVNGEP